MDDKHPDSKLIESLGGAAKLAKKLFPSNKSGIQRVNNWKARGIPARVRLDHPDVFADKPRRKRAA